MNKLRAFWTRLINTLRRAPYCEDFADELETHVAMDTERGIRNGLSPEEARRQALIRFGGIAQAHDAYAERQGLPWLESLLRDVHYSVRSLVRNRLVTAVAIRSRRGIEHDHHFHRQPLRIAPGARGRSGHVAIAAHHARRRPLL